MEREYTEVSLHTAADWGRWCNNKFLCVTPEGVTLGFFEQYELETTGYPFEGKKPLDLAVDPCGLTYLLDAEKRLQVHDPFLGTRKTLPLSDSSFTRLKVSSRHIYLAAPNHVTVYSRERFLHLRDYPLEEELWDLNLDEKGILHLLTTKALYTLNFLDKPDKPTYRAAIGSIKKGRSAAPAGRERKYRIAVFDLVFYLLDSNKRIWSIDLQQPKHSWSVYHTLEDDIDPVSLAVDSAHNLYVGGKAVQGAGAGRQAAPGRTLYLIGQDKQPMALGYGGDADELALTGPMEIHILNKGNQEVAILKKPTRYMQQGGWYDSDAPYSGNYPFLEGPRGCIWGRLVIDADIPADTQLQVAYCVTDTGPGETPELDTRRPRCGIEDAEAEKPAFGSYLVNPPELLIREQGRFLYLSIKLFSTNGLHTPVLRKVTARFPYRSYLEYLPGIYQEDERCREFWDSSPEDQERREFLDRFLALFQSFYQERDGFIAGFPRYLDPAGTPDEFLPWLSSWLALSYEGWTPKQVRRVLGQAPAIYRRRGTPAGFRTLFRLLFPGMPEGFPLVLEYLQSKTSNPAGQQLDPQYYGETPFSFRVWFPPELSDPDLAIARRVVEQEKPAFTEGAAGRLPGGFYLDGGTFLGYNSRITDPVGRQRFCLGKAVLERDTTVDDRENPIGSGTGGSG